MNLITHQRHSKITALFNHAWYGKRLQKLSLDEIALMAAFINERADKNRNDFVHDVNRYFLSNTKTKHCSMIMEILTIVA